MSPGSRASDCVFTLLDPSIGRKYVIMCVHPSERPVWVAACKQHSDDESHRQADMRMEVEGRFMRRVS